MIEPRPNPPKRNVFAVWNWDWQDWFLALSILLLLEMIQLWITGKPTFNRVLDPFLNWFTPLPL